MLDLDAYRLDGRVAVVTGAASGIGAATCEVLATAGATVVCGDLNADGLDATVSIGAGTTLRGLARELPGSLSLDAHFQWSELVKDTTLKASPADFVGDYTARGRILAFGVTLSFTFDGEKGEAKK